MTTLTLTPWFTPLLLPSKFRKFHGMLQVIDRAAVQWEASGHPWIISKSRIGGFTRKTHYCECGIARTAAQSVESVHHCITASSTILVKKLSQDKEVTVNVAPPEPLCNCQPKAKYPSSPICAKKVSLDKGPDREFTTARIMTKRALRNGPSTRQEWYLSTY